MLDPVAMEFEDDPTLLKLFKRPRDTKTACSIVMPETGHTVILLKAEQIILALVQKRAIAPA